MFALYLNTLLTWILSFLSQCYFTNGLTKLCYMNIVPWIALAFLACLWTNSNNFFSICNTEWLWRIDPNFQKHSFLADVFILFTPWKYQKAFGFLMILGGTTQKWKHGPEMGEKNNFNWLSLSLFLSGSLFHSLSVSLSLSLLFYSKVSSYCTKILITDSLKTLSYFGYLEVLFVRGTREIYICNHLS